MSRQIINDSSPSETSGQVGASTINQIEEEKDFFNSSDTYEKEFVTNGDFNTDISGWIEQRGGIEWDNGKLKVTHDNPEANTFTQSTANANIISGKNYQFSFDYLISGVSFIMCDIRVNNVSQITAPSLSEVGLASYKVNFLATETGNLDIRLFASGTPSSSEFATFDNISLKEVVPFDDTSGQVGTSTVTQIENERNINTGLGPELITNGGFDTNSDWSVGTGWSISGGEAIALNTNGNLEQFVSGVNGGKTYRITFDYIYTSGNTVLYAFGNNLGSLQTTQTYSFTTTGTGATTKLQFYGVGTNLNATIDNISVKEVL